MSDSDNLQVNRFNFMLPEDKIAKYPLAERDQSKLLVYKNNLITDDCFINLHHFLPQNSFLVFNNTRVIHARLLFFKSSGSLIEIMCIEPKSPDTPELILAQTKSCRWIALIGNNKKWKENVLDMQIMIKNEPVNLQAQRITAFGDSFLIEFNWDKPFTFAEIIEAAGKIPLPPYLNRDAEQQDEERYQTVYAEISGSVAAPTAGLHFTPNVFKNLTQKGISNGFVTLHVGAGTFKPVKSESILQHDMHEERIYVSENMLKDLLKNSNNLFAVGTTSLRTLESLYWFGVFLLNNHNMWDHLNELFVDQWQPYQNDEQQHIDFETAINQIIQWMQYKKIVVLTGFTKIIIVSGYKIRSVKGIITNFHQPNSTLLMLISAIVGNEWKNIYNHALNNNYRFLSYGDSSLLFCH